MPDEKKTECAQTNKNRKQDYRSDIGQRCDATCGARGHSTNYRYRDQQTKTEERKKNERARIVENQPRNLPETVACAAATNIHERDHEITRQSEDKCEAKPHRNQHEPDARAREIILVVKQVHTKPDRSQHETYQPDPAQENDK